MRYLYKIIEYTCMMCLCVSVGVPPSSKPFRHTEHQPNETFSPIYNIIIIPNELRSRTISGTFNNVNKQIHESSSHNTKTLSPRIILLIIFVINKCGDNRNPYMTTYTLIYIKLAITRTILYSEYTPKIHTHMRQM